MKTLTLFAILTVAVSSPVFAQRGRAVSCGCPCNQQYLPVCGIDGRDETTFSNRCELQCCQKNRPTLKEKFEGVCAEKYQPQQEQGTSGRLTGSPGSVAWGQPSRPAVQPPRGSSWTQTSRPAIQPPRGSSWTQTSRPAIQPPRGSSWTQTSRPAIQPPRGSSWPQTFGPVTQPPRGGSSWPQTFGPVTQPPRGGGSGWNSQQSQPTRTERPWWQSNSNQPSQSSGGAWRQNRGIYDDDYEDY